MRACEVTETRCDPVDTRGVDGVEDDERRRERARGGLGRLERGVASEVGDPPAARPERHAECDQPELVPLSGQARQERRRAEAVAPAARQSEQTSAEDARGEVLLGDRRLAARPALAEVVEIREDDVGQERVDGRDRERAVEDGLRAGSSKPSSASASSSRTAARGGDVPRLRAAPATRALPPARLRGQRRGAAA